MFDVNENVCKHRIKLLGVAAAMILICHSTSVIDFPYILNKIVAYGTVGVYLFAFLSGLGLFFSMQKTDGKRILAFYKRRFERVLVPYLLIAGVWYAILHLIIGHSIEQFIYELSLLSFWIEHKGAWYVAMLIPVYLLYPFCYRWVKSGKQKIKTMILILLVSFVSFALEGINYRLYEHLSQGLTSISIFLIGNLVAYGIYTNQYKAKNTLAISVGVLVVRFFTPLGDSEYFCHLSVGFLGIIIVLLLGDLFEKINFQFADRILEFLGQHSLELYLTNIFILQAVEVIKLEDRLLQAVLYMACILLGVIFSVICKKITNWILTGVCVQHRRALTNEK